MTRARSVAVVPAYNEEETLGEIVQVLRDNHLVERVLVISDGSTDGTADVARMAGAEVIELEQNVGKGGAMQQGIDRADADVYVFLDGDLIGLRDHHVVQLLQPVLKGETEMTIGVFESGRPITDLALQVAPYLSGQRAVHRDVLDAMSGLETARFGVEMALTRHIKQEHVTMKVVTLVNLTHRMKEEKLGILRGFMARLKMYWEIIKHTQPDRDERAI